MKPRLLRIALLLFGIVLAGPGWAQRPIPRAEPARPYQAAPVPSNPYGSTSALERSAMSSVPVDPNRRLAAGDIITVQIQEDRDLPALKKVSATGDLDMSPFGRIRVAGKTTTQVESELKSFLEKDFYYSATVLVALDTVNATSVLRKVTVSGEVRAPGALEIAAGESITLTEAILKAGDFTQWAKRDKVRLFRGGRDQIYDVPKILKEGRVQEDPVLQDGDRIHVDKNWFNIRG